MLHTVIAHLTQMWWGLCGLWSNKKHVGICLHEWIDKIKVLFDHLAPQQMLVWHRPISWAVWQHFFNYVFWLCICWKSWLMLSIISLEEFRSFSSSICSALSYVFSLVTMLSCWLKLRLLFSNWEFLASRIWMYLRRPSRSVVGGTGMFSLLLSLWFIYLVLLY